MHPARSERRVRSIVYRRDSRIRPDELPVRLLHWETSIE